MKPLRVLKALVMAAPAIAWGGYNITTDLLNGKKPDGDDLMLFGAGMVQFAVTAFVPEPIMRTYFSLTAPVGSKSMANWLLR